jgi:hypothetical protein
VEIIILALLGFGTFKLYQFFKFRLGLEFVRAYMFLELCGEGTTPEDANSLISRVVFDPDTTVIRNASILAAVQCREVHGGRMLPLIRYAYRVGLRNELPFFFRDIASIAPMQASVISTYSKNPASTATTRIKDDVYVKACTSYDEYYDEFLKILKTHFIERANVEDYINVLPDTRIRSGYEKGLPAAVIAMQYRKLLEETLLSNDLRR